VYFSYAISKETCHGATGTEYREVRLNFRPFLEGYPVPDKPLCVYFYQKPWPCAPENAVEFPGGLYQRPEGVLHRFECPESHRYLSGHARHQVIGVPVFAFTKAVSADYEFFCLADVPKDQIKAALEALGQQVLDRAGRWLTGGYRLVSLSSNPISRISPGVPVGRRLRA